MGKEEIPNSRSVVHFRDGSFGVVVTPAALRPMDGVDGVDADLVGGTAPAYIVSYAEQAVRQKSIQLSDGTAVSALVVAGNPGTGLALFAIEDAKLENLGIRPCYLAQGFSAVGSVVTIYVGDDLGITSQVIGITPDGDIRLDTAFDINSSGRPAFTADGKLIGFIGPSVRAPQGQARYYAGIDPVVASYAVVIPARPGLVGNSKKKFEQYSMDNNVSLGELKTDPGKYSEMRNAITYRTSALGFRALFSQANGGYVVAGLNDTLDINGQLTADLFNPGNRSLPIYANSDPAFKADFMMERVMTITGFSWFDYSGDPQVSQFGVPSFKTILKEIEQYANFEKALEITAMCYFEDGSLPVEKKYTLTAQAVTEDVCGKKRTRRNYEKSDLVRATDVRLSVINSITVPNDLRIEDTAAFLAPLERNPKDSTSLPTKIGLPAGLLNYK